MYRWVNKSQSQRSLSRWPFSWNPTRRPGSAIDDAVDMEDRSTGREDEPGDCQDDKKEGHIDLLNQHNAVHLTLSQVKVNKLGREGIEVPVKCVYGKIVMIQIWITRKGVACMKMWTASTWEKTVGSSIYWILDMHIDRQSNHQYEDEDQSMKDREDSGADAQFVLEEEEAMDVRNNV